MTTKRDKLQRLDVASPCQSSWEAMYGDGKRRHCLQCDKHVYDFAELSPREIAGLLEATGGRLCGRLTRDGGGRLVTLEPPALALAGNPYAGRGVSPLVATVVAAVLGLAGPAWMGPSAAASPAADQEAGEQPAGERREMTGDAGSSLFGRLTNEAGEPVPDAQITIYNQLDQQEQAGRTDGEGWYVFPSLTAGIYGVQAKVGGHHAAQQWNVLLPAGERRQVGLTVPEEAWQTILASDDALEVGVQLAGAIALPMDPMRKVFADTSLVVVGIAGKSAVVARNEYTWQVRTDLTISSVLKGETGERVISVFHDQMPDEEPASRLEPGAEVLAFLDPRGDEEGGSLDGYVAADAHFGLKVLYDDQPAAYEERLEALAGITRDGAIRPADLVEWLVATVEEPVTRREAVSELHGAVRELARQAEQHTASVEDYTHHLQDVYADFLATGGKPASEANPGVLGAFLTAAQRERLTAALLATEHVTATDLELYELVSRWPDDRLLPWLTSRIETVELDEGTSRRLMWMIAQEVEDEGLADLQAKDGEKIEEMEQELWNAEDDATRQRLEKRLRKAEEELRGRFAKALAKRGAR